LLSAAHGFDVFLHLPEPTLFLVLIQAALRLFRFENPTVADPSGFKTSAIWGDGPEQQIERFTCSFLSNFIHRLQESVVESIISDPGKVENPFFVTKAIIAGVSSIAAGTPRGIPPAVLVPANTT
jgi:hypothetical protein